MPIWGGKPGAREKGEERKYVVVCTALESEEVRQIGLSPQAWIFLSSLSFLVGGNAVSSQALKWKNQCRCENLMRHATLPARCRMPCAYSPVLCFFSFLSLSLFFLFLFQALSLP